MQLSGFLETAHPLADIDSREGDEICYLTIY